MSPARPPGPDLGPDLGLDPLTESEARAERAREAEARARLAETVVLRRRQRRLPPDALFSAALFALALLPRLYVALAWAREPVWDGHYYDFGARRIARGLGYSDDVMVGGEARWHPWCHYPVGYSGFLALAYRAFGDGPRVAPVAGAVVGALLALVVHRLARRAMSPNRARLAGLLVALSPELIAYAALLMTEPLASLGPLVAAWLVARGRAERRPWPWALGAGAVMGLTTLVRPQLVLAAPMLGLIALDPPRLRASLRRALAVAGLATLACLAVVAPWTWRNCRVMDGCAFVSTNAGWNLAIGAFPRATGRFETLRGADGCPVVTGQVQQDRCWGKLGLHYIRHDTRRWLGLVPEKLAQTFDHASFPMGYLGEADPQRWGEGRRRLGREILTRAHGVVLLAAAFVAVSRRPPTRAGRLAQGALGLGLVALAVFVFTDDRHPFWWFAALTPLLAAAPLPGRSPLGPVLRYLVTLYASVVLTHAVFFGEDRYHVVLTPVFALLAAAALPRYPRACGQAPGPSGA
ncbi:MAG TPA: glycosyltransferase family 39 protein [Polyangiaceae bacterium]|nr:glycosyltransferase family 39 protein [Polyangiaceae bacterium]